MGKLYGKEVDFVATKDGRVLYVQATDEMFARETREREIASLKSIRDNHEKTVVVRQGSYDTDIDGIRIVGARDFSSRAMRFIARQLGQVGDNAPLHLAHLQGPPWTLAGSPGTACGRKGRKNFSTDTEHPCENSSPPGSAFPLAPTRTPPACEPQGAPPGRAGS